MLGRHCIGNEIDLNKYIKIKLIGKGSYGTVYLYKEIETNNLYALKMMDIPNDEDEKKYREIEIMMRINHPAIVKCIGYSLNIFKNEKKIGILLEYSENGSLDHLLDEVRSFRKKGVIPPNFTETTRQIILIGIARAMKYLHDRKIIHRDLKPSNILLDNSLYPLISDFGLSKFLDINDQFAQSKNSEAALYMAPEVIINEKYDGMKADVYSFGIIMYEVVTGLSPYSELLQNGTNIIQIINKIIYENYRPIFENDENKHHIKLIQR